MATLRRISDFKPVLTNLAQTSHFQVIFNGMSGELRNYLLSRGVDSRFIGESAGLLCYSASLPGSSYADNQVVGNFTGVVENFAHTRQFTPIDLEFYVDRDYKTVKFLEHWMEFIGSGSYANQNNSGYFFRMQYPNTYKSNQTKILKFDRDYSAEIEYNFFGLYPYSMGSIAVSYENSNVLRATATFKYERYVSGKVSSLSLYQGANNNLELLRSTFIDPLANPLNNIRLATGRDELINRNLNQGTGRLDNPQPVGTGGPIAYEGTRIIP